MPETESRTDARAEGQPAPGGPNLSQVVTLQATAQPVAPPFPQIPGYTVERELGRGGMGVVYLARQLGVNRPVALKMILAGRGADAADRLRFLAEAETLAKLQHPNVVQVYEVGLHADQPYMALEYVAGGTLAQHAARGPLPPRDAAALVAPVARALEAAHALGIVHRDLKPANILLSAERGTRSAELSDQPTREGSAFRAPGSAFPAPKITDFGLAKQVESGAGLTTTGALIGTPRYMAPEQAAGEVRRQGPAVDVWALGVVLYELLTGRPPFQGATMLETLDLVRYADPVAPRRLQPTVPRDLETVCLKCLRKEPAQRYPSAAAVADDLQRFLGGWPVRARPVGRAELAWRWCRRHPAAAVLAVGSLVSVSAVVAVVTTLNRDLEARNRDLALAQRQAEAEAARATAQERQARAVADFLVEAFSHEGEAAADVQQLLAVDVLRRAEAQVEQRYQGDLPTKARVLDALGRTFGSLGEEAKAIALHERALAVRRQALGPDHPDTITSLNNLAVAYQNALRPADALPLHEQALRWRQAHQGANHVETLQTLNNLGLAYTGVGRTADALALYADVLPRMQAHLGPDHPLLLHTLNNLARTYRSVGRGADEVATLEQVVRGWEARVGPDHHALLGPRSNLARAYRSAGRLQEALALFEQAVGRRRAQLGPDHPATLTAVNDLAATFLVLGRAAEAVPLLEPVLARRRGRLGEDHPDTLLTGNDLANAYRDVGRLNDALALFEPTLALMQRRLGPDQGDTLTCQSNLADLYRRLGRLPEAIALNEQALRRRQARLGPDHPDTLTSLNNLAVAYQDAGRGDRAIPLHEQALQARRARLGADHPDTLQSLNNLAVAYQDAGRRADAERQLTDLLAGQRKQVPPPQPAELAVTLVRLGLGRLQLGQFAAAEPVLREALALRAEAQPEAWTTANARSLVGAALLGQRKHAEAEPLLLAGWQELVVQAPGIPPQGRFNLLAALARLVRLYEATDRPQAAAPYRAELARRLTAELSGGLVWPLLWGRPR